MFSLIWSRPSEGFVKVNIDGAVDSTRSWASIGGVIRDAMGSWQCGFSMAIGGDFIFQIDARAMLEGLCLAWDRGFKRVELECNNSLLVESILAGG